MPRLSPILTTRDLPLAELCAARLDGELAQLDALWCPVDEPQTSAARASAVSLQWPGRLIAERHTAAWIWGAQALPPATHELCSSLGARARPLQHWRVAVREVAIDADEYTWVAGLRVTTPLRTVVDIARSATRFDADERAVIRSLMAQGGVSLDDCRLALDRRRNLPGKRRAWSRISDAESGALAGVDAIHVVDGVDASHGVEHPVEVGGVTHLEDEAADREALP